MPQFKVYIKKNKSDNKSILENKIADMRVNLHRMKIKIKPEKWKDAEGSQRRSSPDCRNSTRLNIIDAIKMRCM